MVRHDLCVFSVSYGPEKYYHHIKSNYIHQSNCWSIAIFLLPL